MKCWFREFRVPLAHLQQVLNRVDNPAAASRLEKR
jgi:hypothetical protein